MKITIPIPLFNIVQIYIAVRFIHFVMPYPYLQDVLHVALYLRMLLLEYFKKMIILLWESDFSKNIKSWYTCIEQIFFMDLEILYYQSTPFNYILID